MQLRPGSLIRREYRAINDIRNCPQSGHGGFLLRVRRRDILCCIRGANQGASLNSAAEKHI